MNTNDKIVDIIPVQSHFEGYVNGEFICSGDTWKEVYDDLMKEGYLYGNS